MRSAWVLWISVIACVPDAGTAALTPDARPATIGRDAEASIDVTAVFDAEETIDATEPMDVGADLDAASAPDAALPDVAPPPDAASARDAAVSDTGSCDPMARPAPHAGSVEAPGLGGCPAGMLPAGDVCVDRFEAVLFAVAADGSESAWSPFHNPGTERVRARSIGGVTPQAYINGRQAGAACIEAGKRLCTDLEWLRACRGANNDTYPYGATRQPGVCNDARAQHPAIEYFGTSASWIWSELGNACIDQLPNSLARTGQYAGCVTAEGVHDLMGNLHEWTSAAAGTFRGGYYVDTMINGNGCLYATTAHDTGHWDYSTGFRCCADRP